MATVVWSDRASDDIDGIIEYISKDKPIAAKHLAQRIVKRTKLIASFPRLGRVVPGEEETTREIIYGNYRIIYEIHEFALGGPEIVILTIHHSSRQLDL
jgi:plasmid stabilization system protein ParE